ncbi:3-methyladenine DNA glycosylase/8-oxoguanine DNA glycosylase [Micromonospora phaseoli]|uniref:3-methyladenine DNA glycosylase/8-oxoguanine DNA glycosylase n=1 Tax=Micromonospora phaseoli TaxID=1144548 RepID=A0A1H6RVB3_9ACTN|nr:DNA-3-methyladenine glycosylase [Micromonospora phaseoli]PZW03682.1 3-methyladenine DNA glycosylase/8-oxoguanine DNA glycosylase [Micromonospora phaseoli]GIJ80334.1 3-methyladenine DNA glycosylase [Micromonospora phaseoli]SEI59788.1 3-methyladenine DNA glycosylase/8-oxoguanine DNA glycosylase [Micromonospora phaseoli]
MTRTEANASRALRPASGYRLAASVRPLTFSPYDPCARIVAGVFWWATRTPDGPATLALRPAAGDLVAEGYGPGAGWVVERADSVAGLRDDLTGFADLAATHPVVARLAAVHQGLRMPATGLVFPQVLRAVLEQKVTGKEAYRGYAATVRHFAEPAPGPMRLLLPPDPAAVAAAGYWVFHPFGIEQRRAETLRRAARMADRLQRCADATEATRLLRSIPGVGPWTAAEVVRVAYGDPDAVSVGDYHVPNTVAWALAGEPRGDDARMLALLEPFRGHRGRVCRLLEAAGVQAPKFGPRAPIRSFAHF